MGFSFSRNLDPTRNRNLISLFGLPGAGAFGIRITIMIKIRIKADVV